MQLKKEWRSQTTGIFFPLISYSVIYCKEVIGTQDIVIVTRASVKHFYRAIFGFLPISQKATKHSGVNNQLSFAQYLVLDKIQENFYKLYGPKPPIQKNVYKIFMNFPWREQCDWKKERYNFLCNYSFTLKTMRYFFSEKSDVLDTLSLEDKKILHNLYHNKIYQGLISLENISYNKRRKHPRFFVNMDLTNDKHQSQKIFQISKAGFSVQGTSPGEVFEGHIKINNTTECKVKANRVWTSDHVSGYQIVSIENDKWDDLLHWVGLKTHENLATEDQDDLLVA